MQRVVRQLAACRRWYGLWLLQLWCFSTPWRWWVSIYILAERDGRMADYRADHTPYTARKLLRAWRIQNREGVTGCMGPEWYGSRPISIRVTLLSLGYGFQ